jgi:sirohydrochlorin cobaltochelatase
LKQGIVLLAHGSRDARWSAPFERLAAELSRRLPAACIALSFLEHGRPLREALADVAAQGASQIRVVPVFLGQGAHLNEDLPRLVAAVQKDFPRADIRLEPAIGEQPTVIEAMARAIAGQE